MAGGMWDSSVKRLIAANPQDFVSWLMRDAEVVGELSGHLNRALDADLLYNVRYQGEPTICHIEIQRYRDKAMAERTWEYNVLTTCKYKETALSFIIYLKKGGNIVPSPMIRRLKNGTQIHHFTFVNVKLWEIPTEELRACGLSGILPLLPLTREGGSPHVVEEVIKELEVIQDLQMRKNLFTISMTLASLALDKDDDRAWLYRRFLMYQDILRDTEIYQLIMQEGREQGIKQGREQGIKQVREQELQDLRQLLLSLISRRFISLYPTASKIVAKITAKETLQGLILTAGTARELQEVQDVFAQLKQQN